MDSRDQMGSAGLGSSAGLGAQGTSNSSQSLKDVATDAAEQLKQSASEVTDQAKGKAREMFDGQKGRAVSELETVAEALRQTAAHLGRDSSSPIGSIVSSAAERVDQLRGTLDKKDLGEIISDVEDFARRSPAAFLGGALAIGFIASRFLKSSRPRNTGWNDQGSFRSPSLGSNALGSSYGTTPHPSGSSYVTFGEDV